MKVLVPLDGSERSNGVLPAVLAFAGLAPNVQVHLLSVQDPRAARDSADRPLMEAAPGGTPVVLATPGPKAIESRGEALERLHKEVEDDLYNLANARLPGVDVTFHVRWSKDPAAEILELAGEIGANIIAMASHGRSGLSHLITGSVTEAVIRTAAVPVAVVGPGWKR